jgi:hypothetical protein
MPVKKRIRGEFATRLWPGGELASGRKQRAAFGVTRPPVHNDPERHWPQVDDIAIAQRRRLRDPRAVDEGAVGCSQVSDEELLLTQAQPAVAPGNDAQPQDVIDTTTPPDDEGEVVDGNRVPTVRSRALQ